MELYKKWIEQLIKRKMKECNTYNPAFNNVISVFADMLFQYTMMLKETNNSAIYNDILSTLRSDMYSFGESLRLENNVVNEILEGSTQRLNLYLERGQAV